MVMYLLVYVLLLNLESCTCSLDTHHHNSSNTYISNSLYDHLTSYLIYHHDLYIYRLVLLYLHTLCSITISIDLVCFIYTFVFLCVCWYFYIHYNIRYWIFLSILCVFYSFVANKITFLSGILKANHQYATPDTQYM